LLQQIQGFVGLRHQVGIGLVVGRHRQSFGNGQQDISHVRGMVRKLLFLTDLGDDLLRHEKRIARVLGTPHTQLGRTTQHTRRTNSRVVGELP